MYAWNSFRSGVLENELLSGFLISTSWPSLPMDVMKALDEEGSSKSSEGRGSESEDVNEGSEQMEIDQPRKYENINSINFQKMAILSSLIPDDVLFDVMSCLSALELGLGLSLVSRRFLFFSEFMLNRRRHSTKPMMICDGVEEGTDAFAIPLVKLDAQIGRKKKMNNVISDWWASLDPQNRAELPRIAPPKWITGIGYIYLIGIFNFLNNSNFFVIQTASMQTFSAFCTPSSISSKIVAWTLMLEPFGKDCTNLTCSGPSTNSSMLVAFPSTTRMCL